MCLARGLLVCRRRSGIKWKKAMGKSSSPYSIHVGCHVTAFVCVPPFQRMNYSSHAPRAHHPSWQPILWKCYKKKKKKKKYRYERKRAHERQRFRLKKLHITVSWISILTLTLEKQNLKFQGYYSVEDNISFVCSCISVLLSTFPIATNGILAPWVWENQTNK